MIHLHKKITSKELQFPPLHIRKHRYRKTFLLSSTPFHILYYHLNTHNLILAAGRHITSLLMLLCRLNCFFCPCDGFNFSVFKTKPVWNDCLLQQPQQKALTWLFFLTEDVLYFVFVFPQCCRRTRRCWLCQPQPCAIALVHVNSHRQPCMMACAAGLGMLSNWESGGHWGNRHSLELKGTWGCLICLDSAFGQFYDPENCIEKCS